MNQLNRISLGISATIFTIIGIVLFINPIEHIGSFSWLISCGFFLISLSRFSRYYRLRQAGIIQQQQLFHSMVALVFAVYLLLYGYKTLPIVFPVTLGIWLIYRSVLNFRKANFYSKKIEELSKRYIFFALVQLFIGLFLIVSPLCHSPEYYWFDFPASRTSILQSLVKKLRKITCKPLRLIKSLI